MEKTKILRKSRVIPFGYSVDETGKFLIPIPSELEALEEAKKYLKTCSYREVAKWLHRKTNHEILNPIQKIVVRGLGSTNKVSGDVPRV